MADAGETHGYKRKRKKSFIKKQKQYGKKGRFGQGVQLSEDMYQYFIRILEVVNSSKDNPEDLENLAANVIDEMSGKEVDTCSNQLASRVVEQLLDYAADDKLLLIAEVFGKELRLVYSDTYCSHVLQTMAMTLAKRVLAKQTEGGKSKEDKISAALVENFIRIARFGLNNLEDFIFDTYANRVLRTLFSCANGIAVKTEEVKDYEEKTDVKQVPEEFSQMAADFVQTLSSWPQFNDLAIQVLPSACLQALVLAVRNNPKLSKKMAARVLETTQSYSNIDLTDEKHQPLLHLVEAAIVASPPKLFSKFYENLFKGKLKTLSVSKNCNFAAQKIILHCPVKETFEEIFDELADSFDDFIRLNFTGVLLALAKSCRRLKSRQGEFSKALLSKLDCWEPQERQSSTLPVICCLTQFDTYNAETSKIHLHGSIIAQEMLYFTKPIRLVSSLLSMPEDKVIALLSDPRGCHITDAYVGSTFVGEKSREKLFKKLLGHYGAMASSKHGSRTFDAIWSFLNVKQKSLVVDELKTHQSAIVSTPWGRTVATKTRLDLYRQDREGWMRQIAGGQKKEKTSKKDKKNIKNE